MTMFINKLIALLPNPREEIYQPRWMAYRGINLAPFVDRQLVPRLAGPRARLAPVTLDKGELKKQRYEHSRGTFTFDRTLQTSPTKATPRDALHHRGGERE
jgi:hypothetical protein